MFTRFFRFLSLFTNEGQRTTVTVDVIPVAIPGGPFALVHGATVFIKKSLFGSPLLQAFTFSWKKNGW